MNLLVVPDVMRTEVVRLCHEKGHFSVLKTKALIERDYWIPNVEKEIAACIENCIRCIVVNAKSGRKEGFLNPIEKMEVPLDTLHVDHVGPMPTTNKKYQYILTVVDAFTKFTWLFPVKGTTAEETVQKLQVVQDVFGNPRRIVTDRGTAFTATLFERYCKDNDIQHVLITTGLPRANGQVERMHRTIINVLSKLSIEKPNEWYKNVSGVQRFLNATHQRSIATSPFKLLTGVDMRLKDGIRILEELEGEARSSFSRKRYELRSSARLQIEKTQLENRREFNNDKYETIRKGMWWRLCVPSLAEG